MPSQNSLNFVLNGCSPGTGNLGVSALLYSLLAGLQKREPSARISIVGLGKPGNSIQPFGTPGPAYDVLALNHSRRFYSPRSTSNYAIWNRLGIPMTRIARVLSSADALLDVSAGDSFTDLYGPHRFDSICFLKEVALARGIPLILLPQTYGPFRQQFALDRAAAILQKASVVCSRDAESAAVALDLLAQHQGTSRSSAQHKQGVDLAFALPIHRPSENEEMIRFSNQRSRAKSLVGFNISGLIYNRPESARATFSLRADYQEVVTRLLACFLEGHDVNVVLVPHVITEPGSYESDLDACRHARSTLPSGMQHRVHIAPACTDPREVKWYISQCDWFCGTRMHSTIAALSAGVPACSIAYSMKTRGVFETCGVADEVFDPRVLDTEAVIDQVYQSWSRREAIREVLKLNIPRVVETSQVQLDAIVQSIRNPNANRSNGCVA
jgi:polysaccharide pyruvyl transferase WcaK-like protein